MIFHSSTDVDLDLDNVEVEDYLKTDFRDSKSNKIVESLSVCKCAKSLFGDTIPKDVMTKDFEYNCCRSKLKDQHCYCVIWIWIWIFMQQSPIRNIRLLVCCRLPWHRSKLVLFFTLLLS